MQNKLIVQELNVRLNSKTASFSAQRVTFRMFAVHIQVSKSAQINNIFASALRIHLSATAHSAIIQFPGYVTEPRGETYVKVPLLYT